MRFLELEWWADPVARSGPEAMAVDEWMLETADRPRLRVYQWSGAWASIGYFGNFELAKTAIPNRQWVRRRSGGGVVDHADDWTYSLAVPGRFRLARARGGESYLFIHRALVHVLRAEGIKVSLAAEPGDANQALCFRNPVPHDVVLGNKKIAGAGQRRSRYGLLHQGSVLGWCEGDGSMERTKALATALSESVSQVELKPSCAEIQHRMSRYPVC